MINSAHILNLQSGTGIQARSNPSRQNTTGSSSFLNLLRSAADAINNANVGNENFLNNAARTNDMNNGGIKTGKLSEASGVREMIREIGEMIVSGTEDESERIDLVRLLAMLGVPAEAVQVIIPAVIGSDSMAAMEMGMEMGFEGLQSGQVLVSAGGAAGFIEQIAGYVYSGGVGEIIDTAEAGFEAMQDNIADFADILDGALSGETESEAGIQMEEFKSAVAGYVSEKIVSDAIENGAVRLNAENVKEAVRAALNGDGGEPELDLLSAVRTRTDAAANPDMFDYLNSMRRAFNFNVINAVAAEETETAQGQTAAGGAPEITMPNPESETDMQNPGAVISAGMTGEASPLNSNDLSGAAGSDSGSEVDITGLSKRIADISEMMAGKDQIVLNPVNLNAAAETYEVRLRLKPVELGEVFLKITYSAGNVALNIVASNPAAERAILSQMGELRDTLEAQEIKLGEFNLSNFENNARQQQGRRGENNGSGGNRNRENSAAGSVSRTREEREEMEKLESDRREVIANYIRSRRILYKTV